MAINLKFELIIITMLFFILVIYLIHKKKFELRYSLIWIALSIISVIIAIVPASWIQKVSTFLGIVESSNMLFLFGIVGLLVLLCHMTIIVSKQSKNNIKLIQELSILKERVNKLEKEELKYGNKE